MGYKATDGLCHCWAYMATEGLFLATDGLHRPLKGSSRFPYATEGLATEGRICIYELQNSGGAGHSMNPKRKIHAKLVPAAP